MKNSKFLMAVAVTALVVGAGGFLASIQYQKSKGPAMGDLQRIREQFRSGDRPSGFGGRFQGQGVPTSGEIISRDEESITVKMPDGSSQIIFVGESAEINKSVPGTKEDLTNEMQVFVIGSENPDGSLNATSIQIGR